MPATEASRGELDGPEIVLSAENVSRRYPGVVANDRVSLAVNRGEIHGLLGENGSGKTTLCSILAGSERPDEGEISVNGRQVWFRSPDDAFRAGIFMVHQHFTLVKKLTVAQNVVLGWMPQRAIVYRRRQVEAAVAELSERYHLPVDPKRPVWQLSVGEQQRVEILKALYRGAQILVMDEPTAVLTPQEADSLCQGLRQLVRQGKSVIFVSHKLPEVIEYCDQVTVLRLGKVIGNTRVEKGKTNTTSLSRMMVGRDIEMPAPRSEHRGPSQPVLRVSGLGGLSDIGHRVIEDVSFEVARGEILGIVGVAGNGQHELAEVLAGLRTHDAGEVMVDGKALRPDTRPHHNGTIGYVPADRFGVGLVPEMTVAENLCLRVYRSGAVSSRGLLSHKRMDAYAQGLIDDFQIKGTARTTVSHLSGGHAQRVLIAREVQGGPALLIVETPTRGLDVAAAAEVYRVLRDAASADVATVVISEDLDEVLTVADRLAVIYRGRVRVIPSGESPSREVLGMMMAGAEA